MREEFFCAWRWSRMKPTTNAPKTVKGMAIMNNTLKLNARPSELFNALAQLGQACAAKGVNNTNAQNTNAIVRAFLGMVAFVLFENQDHSYLLIIATRDTLLDDDQWNKLRFQILCHRQHKECDNPQLEYDTPRAHEVFLPQAVEAPPLKQPIARRCDHEYP